MDLLRYAVTFAVGCSFGWIISFIANEIQEYIERAYGVNDDE